MKNLETMGVQELNANEMKETEGGNSFFYDLGYLIGSWIAKKLS